MRGKGRKSKCEVKRAYSGKGEAGMGTEGLAGERAVGSGKGRGDAKSKGRWEKEGRNK